MIAWLSAQVARIGWRRLASWGAVVVAILTIEAILHDPFGWRKAKMARLEAAAASAKDDVRARSLEVAAERESAVKVARVAETQARTQAATETLILQAAAAPDADQPLDAARLARLRAHDAAICTDVSLTGCEAPKP